jgi:hypothetical protein
MLSEFDCTIARTPTRWMKLCKIFGKIEYTVYERKKYCKDTKELIQTDSENEAINVFLLGEKDGE